MPQSSEEITGLLRDWRNGNRDALDKLIPIVYDDLRRIARRYIRRQAAGQTLQTTAVVHEAYMRLAGKDDVDWQNRAHFYGVCAQVMRSLLVDRARARGAAKRGGGLYRAPMVDPLDPSDNKAIDIIALDGALEGLASIDPRKAKIVELRYFGGLTVEETASFLDLSPITIKREWLKAKAWLYNELNNENRENRENGDDA
ncbi:MAG TPA: ECF-type sigma factor [Blastocatellia bacterium]|nr:ECF-type sigma factor [Blastocatellia bacterium]